VGRSGKLQVGCARRKSPLPYGARQVPPWRVLRPRSLTPRRQPLEKSATDWRTQVKEIEEANEAGTFALSALLVARALPRANTEQSRRRSKHTTQNHPSFATHSLRNSRNHRAYTYTLPRYTQRNNIMSSLSRRACFKCGNVGHYAGKPSRASTRGARCDCTIRRHIAHVGSECSTYNAPPRALLQRS
jgi:hypothetical protein